MSTKNKCRNYALVVITIGSVIDHILGLFYLYNAIFSLLVRPVVVFIFFSSIRSNLFVIAHTCKDTMIILLTILSYVMLFALVGYYLFRDEFEGITLLSDMNASYYQLLILLTTANFPDVMLPAYDESFFYSIFFVVYLVIGLYFFLNILLANVFSMYKKRLESKQEKKFEARKNLLRAHFDKFDMG